MSRPFRLSALVSVTGLLASGCGASRPRPEDVFHDPALRRSSLVLEADEIDRTLLSRLPHPAPGEAITIDGRVFVPGRAYRAASGALCQPVQVMQSSRGASSRLACESEGGPWVFVPDVFGGDDPFAREDGVASEAER